jgi:hypothetical protein
MQDFLSSWQIRKVAKVGIKKDTADLGSVHFPRKTKQTIRRLVD